MNHKDIFLPLQSLLMECSILGVAPCLLLTLQLFCVDVLAVVMRNAWHCWFHWNLQLLSGVLVNRVNFFNFVVRNIVNFPLHTCSLYYERIWP